MPDAWAKLLMHSGISAAEKKKNPQGVIKALEFYTGSGVGEVESKFMTAPRYGDGGSIIIVRTCLIDFSQKIARHYLP